MRPSSFIFLKSICLMEDEAERTSGTRPSSTEMINIVVVPVLAVSVDAV